ncbi:hypothetical protein ACE1ET_18295 [Saccharicrinis sp. FJH62]|uniref:homocitrate synthase/isopropylmalate synthase family protein n=1 Tax=Saccharicrinis sp. FJH62 TaxID=3344657 RepID=UPI0035D47447
MVKERKYLVDTTLRDGEQAPGVVFFQPDKLEIAAKLDALGIEELEIGTPAMGEEEVADMQAIVAMKRGFISIAWCRAMKYDIDMAEKSGVDAVNISFPVSHLHLMAMDKSPAWVLDSMDYLLPYALNKFDRVYIGAQDASRAEYPFLQSFVEKAFNLGAERVRIADTVGVMNPVMVSELFGSLREIFPSGDFEFHPHNDLGMATANAITALMSGANSISGTVNGLGERAGNAAIEEVIMGMNQALIASGPYNFSVISELSQLVAERSNIQLHPSKPIVGENAFSHETGIHTRCILKNKLTYQPFDESVVGKKQNRIVFGKHSGKASVESFFKDRGIILNSIQLMMIMRGIRDIAMSTRTILSDNHVMNVYHSLFT